MLSVTKETKTDKAKKTLSDVVSYVDDIVRDERLRADIGAAARHGAKASDRVKKDVDAGSIASRLADDKKLRRNLRAMLDDLDDAGKRVRGRKSHRVRNVLLVLGGAVGTLVFVPRVRLWLSERTSDVSRTPSKEPAPLV